MFYLSDRAHPAPATGARLGHWRHAAALTILICGTAAVPAAAQVPLSLAEARRLAVERSRQLVAQDLAVTAARDMAIGARQLPDPVLSVGIDNVPVSGPDRWRLGGDFMTMQRVGIAQELTRSDKRQLRAERFEQEAQRALSEKNASTATIERETAIAWLERYYAEAIDTVIRDQLAEARHAVDAAQAAYRGGRGSQADVFAARAEVAGIEDRRSEYGRRIRNATTMLTRWVGTTAAARLGARPDIDQLDFDPAHLDEQLGRHPDIATLEKQEEIAQSDVRLAEANKRPDWSVEVGYQRRGNAYPDMISFGLSIPLQWDQKRRQDREVAARVSLAGQAGAQREEALRQHVAQTRTLLDEWTNDRERLARYAGELVPLAQQRTTATLTAYRGGKASLVEVLAARRGELDVRIQALQLEADTARAWAQLNFLIPQSGARHLTGKERE